MVKYLIFLLILFNTLVVADENEIPRSNDLKNLNMLSAYGVSTICHVEPRSALYVSTGVEYAWGYFLLKRISIGLSYSYLAFYYPGLRNTYDNQVSLSTTSLSTIGLRTGYYFGNKKSIIVPHLSIEGRIPVEASNTYETSGLLWNYSAGSLIKVSKYVYLDLAGSIMYGDNYFYNIAKLGICGMIY